MREHFYGGTALQLPESSPIVKEGSIEGNDYKNNCSIHFPASVTKISNIKAISRVVNDSTFCQCSLDVGIKPNCNKIR